ncbi:hypothetical protein [Actinoalloteichus hoggarensis]|uniref:hypothetical protein n=1 Tax=Actinoalloteichus hoggarensis TaxID=1470176 RepID=UPI0012FE4C6C|nr:hypothetical protein [Actinoalloteichus hoggarensis]
MPTTQPGDEHGEHGQGDECDERLDDHDTTIEHTFYFGKISIEWYATATAGPAAEPAAVRTR